MRAGLDPIRGHRGKDPRMTSRTISGFEASSLVWKVDVTLYELVAGVDRPHHAACVFPTRHISKMRKEGRSHGTHTLQEMQVGWRVPSFLTPNLSKG